MSERSGNFEPGADEDDETVVDKLEELAALLVLGVGLVALFLGYGWFWIVFAVGFAVFVPMVHVLGDLLIDTDDHPSDERADRQTKRPDRETERPDRREDSLETLKRQYASGEIDEAEFERRLEVLVDADSPDDVAARLERLRDRSAADRAVTADSGDGSRDKIEDRELER